jgi:hypothetical protein
VLNSCNKQTGDVLKCDFFAVNCMDEGMNR